MLPGGEVQGRPHLIVYVAAQAVLIIMTIVDLALNKWFHYCFWDFGLEHAEPIYDWDTDDYDDSTIAEVNSDFCDSSIPIGHYCPDFCSYISNFEGAGGAMIFFGVLTLLAAVAAVTLHVLAFFNKPFKHWLVWVWMSLPTVFWLLGTIIYGSVTNITGIDDVNRGDEPGRHYYPGSEPKNADPEAGLILCAFIVVLQFILLCYALLTTRKNFLSD